jgi:hypothetical protein
MRPEAACVEQRDRGALAHRHGFAVIAVVAVAAVTAHVGHRDLPGANHLVAR